LIKERERGTIEEASENNEKEGGNLCKSSPVEPYTEKEEQRSIQILTIQWGKRTEADAVSEQ
jgi:hypothetical protein